MTMLKYAHILQYFYSNAWAMRPDKLQAIDVFLQTKASGVDVSAEEIEAMVQAARPGRPAKAVGNVAVLPILGVISHRASMMSDISEPTGASAEKLSKQFAALMADPSVGTIVLDVDSPGGTVSGVPELADQIFDARGKKKVYAVVNSQAASAAYWLASQAEEIIVTPSGDVGSIGVFMMHQDMSERMKMAGVNTTFIKAGRYKTEGNPYMPLDEEAEAAFQERVNRHYDDFVKAVARGRGVKVSDVKNGFGEGRMVMALDAVKAGMADRVATMEDTMKRLGVDSGNAQMIQAEEDVPIVESVEPEVAETKPESDDLRRIQRDLLNLY